MSEIRVISNKLILVPLARLLYQYIPEFINRDIWHDNMQLANSPQVECAKLLLKHGRNWGKLKHCRFAEDRRHRYKLGMKKWTEKNIKEHILGSRYNILMSLKKYGFDVRKNKKQPVTILQAPFWRTRFGGVPNWVNGWEIYHGGRRCASMYALGMAHVPVLFATDKHPGSKKGGKFEEKVLRWLK